MKAIILGLVLVGLVNSALAVDRGELNAKIGLLIAKFNALQQNPAERIPSAVLRKARGVVLLDRVKAGFVFGGDGGGGVAIVKENSGDWSPVAFVRSTGGSVGFQAGGEEEFCVLLLMNTDVTRQLADSTIQFSDEARGTAGNNSAGAKATFNAPAHSVLVYADRSGFYGGVAFEGNNLAPDRKANEIYYGRPLTMDDILFEPKVAPTKSGEALAHAIRVYSQ
jgi:SH3 domain-containing YSC84-like protein 1